MSDHTSPQFLKETEEDLLRYLTSKLGLHDAQEVAQESYIKFFSLKDSQVLEDPRSFLFKIARNTMIDHIRASRRFKRSELEKAIPYDEDSSTMVDNRSAERAMTADQELARVVSVIDSLPTACRQAFILNRFEGLTYTEIAKVMKISISMVEKHIGKALYSISVGLG